MKALKILFILGFLSLRITSEEATTEPPADSQGDQQPQGDTEAESGDGAKKEKLVGHCDKALLEAYDIEADWETVEDKNLLCPEIKDMNCCSYRAQMDIFRKWVGKGERERVLNTYK
jgi:hypothetical protein